jgi:hypothetical protein
MVLDREVGYGGIMVPCEGLLHIGSNEGHSSALQGKLRVTKEGS